MTRKLYRELSTEEEYLLENGNCIGVVFDDADNCSKYTSCSHHGMMLLTNREYDEFIGQRITVFVPAGDIDGERVYRRVLRCSECAEQVDAESNYCRMCGVRLVNDEASV